MKILFITTRLPHSKGAGAHALVLQRILRLHQRGHDISLVAFGSDDAEKLSLSETNFLSHIEMVTWPSHSTFRKRCRDYVLSPVPLAFARYHSEAMAQAVGRLVEERRPDVVVAESSCMGQYLYRNPYLSAVRRVISCHQCAYAAARRSYQVRGLSPRGIKPWFDQLGLGRYEFDMYRSADRVVVLSPQERLVLQTNAPDLRVTVVPIGVDVEYFQRETTGRRKKNVLYTGYYDDNRNRDALTWFTAKVWPLVKLKHPEARFDIVGPKQEKYLAHLEARYEGVHVSQEVEDVRTFLSKARVFVCPVRGGAGFRGKILEAMASGVPVVSTTSGSEGVSIHVGKNGFLADKPEIMAMHIDLLLRDDELYEDIATTGRTMAEQAYTWDQGIVSFEDVLREVTGRRTSKSADTPG